MRANPLDATPRAAKGIDMTPHTYKVGDMKAEQLKLAARWRKLESKADRNRVKERKENPDSCAVSIFATQGICYDECASELEALAATLPDAEPAPRSQQREWDQDNGGWSDDAHPARPEPVKAEPAAQGLSEREQLAYDRLRGLDVYADDVDILLQCIDRLSPQPEPAQPSDEVLEGIANWICNPDGRRTAQPEPAPSLSKSQMKRVGALVDEPAQPSSDRAMLLNLMQQFDTQIFICPECKHEDDTNDMDMAQELRDYLATLPQQGEGHD